MPSENLTPPTLTRVRVAPQSDFLQQQARATPIQALAECVWNSLDADAKSVEIILESNALGLQQIIIRDNGRATTRSDAPDLFRKLGDSWKRRLRRSSEGRELHGSEGRGRYKVTALGRIADWRVVYRGDDGNFRQFVITLNLDDLTEILFTEDRPVDASHSGVELVISEPIADFRSLVDDEAPQKLAEIFATYLRSYQSVNISWQGLKIDPSVAIASTAEYKLSDIKDGGAVYSANLEIVEWRRQGSRVLYLCDDRGFPMLNAGARWHVGDHSFSAYLRSQLVREMSDRNEISLGEMNPNLADSIEEARQRIKDYFRKKAAAAAQTVVSDWKAENIYPYAGPPSTEVEKVEQEVFDIVAVTATKYLPDFTTSSATTRAFNLRMMKTAIENGSADLQMILK